jgi:hypothetical protein
MGITITRSGGENIASTMTVIGIANAIKTPANLKFPPLPCVNMLKKLDNPESISPPCEKYLI